MAHPTIFGKHFGLYQETTIIHNTRKFPIILKAKTDPQNMKHIKLIPALLLALASFVSLNAQDTQASFQDFLSQFPKAELPYTFSAQTLQTQLETRPAVKAERLDWNFYQFLPELERSAEFSSMPVHPEPLVAFETAQYHAVVYNLARGLARSNKSYSITVFTKEGAYVGTHFIAGVTAESLTAATIDEALNANVIEYKVNWAKNYRDNGYINNNVIGLTMIETGKFQLASSGNPDQIQWATCSNVHNAPLAEMK
jgi:hypothetical protein